MTQVTLTKPLLTITPKRNILPSLPVDLAVLDRSGTLHSDDVDHLPVDHLPGSVVNLYCISFSYAEVISYTTADLEARLRGLNCKLY